MVVKSIFRGLTGTLFSLIVFLFLYSPVFAAEYRSPEGIVFHSESANWNSVAKLQQVYQELLRNGHGEEIKLLSSVTIVDGYPKGKNVAGEYQFHSTVDTLGRNKMMPGQIFIFGGNERNTIESIAKTLSHEYGHHVTHYYSIMQDGFSITDEARWSHTTYAKLRGLSNDPRINSSNEHRWQLAEIAAEDYVQLCGSPTAKLVHPFPSRFDMLANGQQVASIRWDASMFNVAPQENTDLPLAAQVPGLYDWFADHLGLPKNHQLPRKPELQVAGVVKQGEAGYQVKLAWSGDSDPQTMYTLVSYKEGDVLPEPVVTRTGAQPLNGVYGAIVVVKPTSILTYQDPNATGVHRFRVYAQNAAGFVISSPIVEINMSDPRSYTVSDFTVNQTQTVAAESTQINETAVFPTTASGWFNLIFQAVEATLDTLGRMVDRLLHSEGAQTGVRI
ncbi:hypothetical protein [Effusibacillus dendaii]|uniref:Uncharacterized protein n=1 Tax=Effusibacillus dendaii TaxID=2743772 RepID=A0A7I8D5H1_9BACL|nr:hypothetical protein [Effusibacillus dendaii]BCJ85378.1 hypothetical protein skT53_03630 [Effusibacillus dendaii]